MAVREAEVVCTRILRLRSGLEIEKGTIENPDPVRGTGDFGPRVVRADTRVQGRAGSEGPARLHVSRRDPPLLLRRGAW